MGELCDPEILLLRVDGQLIVFTPYDDIYRVQRPTPSDNGEMDKVIGVVFECKSIGDGNFIDNFYLEFRINARLFKLYGLVLSN